MSDQAWREQWRSERGELPDLEPCTQCCIEMPARANRCIKCGFVKKEKFKFRDMSAATLGLIVALTTVVTNAIPVVTKALLSKTAEPRTGFIGTNDDGTVEISVLNNGAETAVLQDALIYIDNINMFKKFNPISYTMIFDKKDNSVNFRNVKLNDIHTIIGRMRFERPMDIDRMRAMFMDRESRCYLHVKYTAPSGDQEQNVDFDCPRLFPLLANDIDKLPG